MLFAFQKLQWFSQEKGKKEVLLSKWWSEMEEEHSSK